MPDKIRIAALSEFDVTAFPDGETAIAGYPTVVLEEDDPAARAQALGTVARARGMTERAKATGVACEAPYKALRPESQPRFDTINRVCHALGVRLVAQRLGVTDGSTDELAP